MKKAFKYITLSILVALSFYYTDKVTDMTKESDPIMLDIKEYASN